jgi:hypothetical protein
VPLIAQPHAIHLTPSQGPPSIVLFFKNICTRDRRARRCHRQHRWLNLGGREYDYLLKNLRGQLRELSPSPTRSLEWPLTLGARRQVSHLSSYRQSPQWGPQAKSASGLHFGCKLPAIPLSKHDIVHFSRSRIIAEPQSKHWEHLWSRCDPSIALFRLAIERHYSSF